MTRWQAVSQNGRRGKGKKGRGEGGWGASGAFVVSLSLPKVAPEPRGLEGSRNSSPVPVHSPLLLLLLLAFSPGWTVERDTADRKMHLGRRPWPHVLTAGGSCRQGCESGQVTTNCSL